MKDKYLVKQSSRKLLPVFVVMAVAVVLVALFSISAWAVNNTEDGTTAENETSELTDNYYAAEAADDNTSTLEALNEDGALYDSANDETSVHNHVTADSESNATHTCPITPGVKDAQPLPITSGNLGSGSYYLDKDTTLAGTVNIIGNVNLCLYGHVLQGNDTFKLFTVAGNCTFNLYDCDENTSHYFKVGNDGKWSLTTDTTGAVDYDSLTARPAAGTIVSMKGGCVTGGNTEYGAAIDISSYATTYIHDGNIVGNNVSKCGVVNVATNATLVINGGIFAGNTGEVVRTIGTVDMNGGKIQFNAAPYGSALNQNWTSTGDFTMCGGDISYNSAQQQGGGIALFKNKANFYGGEIHDNICGNGGGVYFGGDEGTSFVYVGKNMKIYNNIDNATNKNPNNVYVETNHYVVLGTGEYKPTEDMQIGISMKTPGIFVYSGASEDDRKYFTSDSASYGVKLENNQLKLDNNFVTVTFDVRGHGVAPATQTVLSGDRATKPDDPSEEGYLFDGWYSDKECTTSWDFDNTVTSNTTLYAKWLPIVPGYTDAQVVKTDYTGEPINLVTGSEGSTTITSSGTIYFRVKKDGKWLSEDWSTEIPTGTLAGAYGIYYKIDANKSYLAVEETLLGSARINEANTYNQVTDQVAGATTITPTEKNIVSALVKPKSIKFVEINDNTVTPVNVQGYNKQLVHEAIVKVENGFKYADGSMYDLYIKFTDVKVTKDKDGSEVTGTWQAGYTSSPSYLRIDADKRYNGTEYNLNYEAWLIEAGKDNILENRATFKFVGGSCYLQSKNEICRPWSKDDKIYVSYGSRRSSTQTKALNYFTETNGWSWVGDYDYGDVVTYGEGTTNENSIKGGYQKTYQSCSCELVFGYEVTEHNVVFVKYKDAEGREVEVKVDVTDFPEGQPPTVKVPDEVQNTGQHIVGWKCNQNVTLTDGTVIQAGDVISSAQANEIVLAADLELTTAHENHTYAYTANDDTLKTYCTTLTSCPYYGNELHHDNAVDLTIIANDVNYTGSPVTASISDEQKQAYKTFTNTDAPAIEYYNEAGTKLEGGPTDAGKYTARITLGTAEKAATASKEFTIYPKEADVVYPTSKTMTYNNEEQNLVVEGSATGGHLEYSIDKVTYGEVIPTGKNAGTYDVYFMFKATEAGYSDKYFEAPITSTIAKAKHDDETLTADILAANTAYKSVTLTNTPDNMDYNTPTYDESVSAAITDFAIVDNTLLCKGSSEVTAGTNYVVTIPVYGNDNANYADYNITITLTGKAAEQNPAAISLIYNGNDQALIKNGKADGYTFYYRLNTSDEWSLNVPQASKAGTYYVYYAIAGGGTNYPIANDKPVEASISKATINVTPYSGQTKPYDGTTAQPSYQNDTPVSGEEPAFEGNLGILKDGVAAVDAGTYDIVKNTLMPKDNESFKAANYDIALPTTAVTYTISTATINVTPNSGQTKPYDGTTAQPAYDYTTPVTTETPKFTGSLALKDNAVNVGTYEIIGGNLALADNGPFKASNYQLKLSEPVITYEIKQATLTVTPDSEKTSKYGETIQTLTYSYTGQIGSEIPAFSGALDLGGNKDAGAWNIAIGTLSLKDGSSGFLAKNYAISLAEIKYIITKRALTLTSGSSTKVYDSTPLKETTVTVAGDGYASGEGDKVTYDFVERTEVGISTNSFVVNWNKQVKEGNYDTAYVYGNIEVTSAEDADVKVDAKSLQEIKTKYQDTNPGHNITVDLVVSEDGVKPSDVEKIQAKVGSKKVSQIDATLVVKVDNVQQTDAGSTNDVLIPVQYKFDYDNKKDFELYRVHNDVLAQLTDTPNELGEFVTFENDAGTVTVSAKRYSCYSVAYNDVVTPSPDPTTGGSGDSTLSSTGSSTSDFTWNLFAVLVIAVAVSGCAIFIVSRKGWAYRSQK